MASGDVTLTYTSTATVTYPAAHYPAGTTSAQIIAQESAAGEILQNFQTVLEQRNQLGATATVSVAIAIA